jgi:predicted DNA binding CopG/RHH family protein
MHQSSELDTAPNLAGFASLLASLAAQPRKDADEWIENVNPSHAASKTQEPVAASTDDAAQATDAASDLTEQEQNDESTLLSYESALRTHARYHAAPESDWLVRERETQEQAEAEAMAATGGKSAEAQKAAEFLAEKLQPGRYLERDLKCSSITIRMSAAECAQLRQRAVEAGMTVSAYLRSCTFEAEALRAQVKEVMAELRAEAAEKLNDTEKSKKKFSPRDCFARLLGLEAHAAASAMDSRPRARA